MQKAVLKAVPKAVLKTVTKDVPRIYKNSDRYVKTIDERIDRYIDK